MKTVDRQGRIKQVVILTPDEAHALMDTCNEKTLSGLRNRALIHVLYKSGLRVSEALALTVQDSTVKPSRETAEHAGTHRLHVRNGKGGIRRDARLYNGGADDLQAWLDVRDKYQLPADAPIFCQISSDKFGQPVSANYVDQMLKRLADKAGIEKRVHAHAFRHTHASEMHMRGMPAYGLKKQLGHAKLVTTYHYLEGLGQSPADDALDAFHWED